MADFGVSEWTEAGQGGGGVKIKKEKKCKKKKLLGDYIKKPYKKNFLGK